MNMGVSILASVPCTPIIYSSSDPSRFPFPHRLCRLPNSLQGWICCKGKSNTRKLLSLWRVHLDSEESTNHGADHSHSLPSFQIAIQRRAFLPLTAVFFSGFLHSDSLNEQNAVASDFADMPALRGKDYGKPKMRYPDFRETESGLQYKDLRIGTGSTPKDGETVVVDWDGYTIGYYGRIFEARNKPKGGSFEGNEKGYFRFKVGNHEVIPAFEEAISTMNVGGVRRIIVPPDLGYPDSDFTRKGPKPTTFSGQRALDFVLKNQGLIDKTLLFDIELLKISPT